MSASTNARLAIKLARISHPNQCLGRSTNHPSTIKYSGPQISLIRAAVAQIANICTARTTPKTTQCFRETLIVTAERLWLPSRENGAAQIVFAALLDFLASYLSTSPISYACVYSEPVISSSICSLFLDGPAGHLEALLNAGNASATHAGLFCHPHPLYGGTLHNKVVFHAMKALNSFGFPVLRFNFRGTGLSEGEHDHGHGEIDDVRAALDLLAQEFRLPLIFAGFSFGAAVGLRVSCDDERVKAVIGLGVPVNPVDERTYDF